MRKSSRENRMKTAAGWMLALGILFAAPMGLHAAEENGESIVVLTAEEDAQKQTGSYTVGDGWVKVEEDSTEETEVYRMSGSEALEETSTITLSYLDTNYSVLEYEQLRDMLTNNLMYSNVNAQISTSAIYTDAKDYLYILTADDSTLDYRELYYYVVGDQRCFSVAVREYRAEAEAQRAAKLETPEEAAQKIAREFTWN